MNCDTSLCRQAALRHAAWSSGGFSRSRRGFSLIEIIVVIGVILLLMAMGVIGFTYLQKSASGKATHVALLNCESMVAEFAANGNTITMLPNATVVAPAYTAVAPGGVNRLDAVNWTLPVMQRLIRIPKNKDMMSGLPTKALVEVNGARQQVLADGWGNPIIFVGSAGLSGVKVGGNLVAYPGLGQGVLPAPDGRPFWASAGPDGDFSTGDDNVYSFEK